MKVLVIGAAGKSGEALVDEALAAGHKVTAFVRGAAQYKKANVRVVAGDALDAAAVDAAVAGQDAVIDALGGKTPNDVRMYLVMGITGKVGGATRRTSAGARQTGASTCAQSRESGEVGRPGRGVGGWRLERCGSHSGGAQRC
jgi:putative NADH-flavin reductase